MRLNYAFKLFRGLISYRHHSTNNFQSDTIFGKLFGKHLLITNTVSYSTLMALGDFIEQKIECIGKDECVKEYDWRRNGKMFAVGIILGPFHHYFYKYLDSYLPGVDVASISKKICVDVLLGSSLCTVLFYGAMGVLQRDSTEEILKETKSKFLPTFLVDGISTIPTQIVNFYYFSPKYRVLFVTVKDTVFDVFLSYMKFSHGVDVG